MKKISIFLIFVALIFSLQSCGWLISQTQPKFAEQWGYITDTNGVGIPDVKITVLMAETHSSTAIETNRFFYTDAEGYYNIYIDNSDSVYYMKMTHNDYIYPMFNKIHYPQISYGGSEYVEEDYEMVKLGKVKIEGEVMCDEEDFIG